MNTGDFARYIVPPNRPDGLEIRLRCSSEASAYDSLKLYACGQALLETVVVPRNC